MPTKKQQFVINTRRRGRSRKRLPPMHSRDALALRNYMGNYDLGDEGRTPPPCTPGEYIVEYLNEYGFIVQVRSWTLEDAQFQQRIRPNSIIRDIDKEQKRGR